MNNLHPLQASKEVAANLKKAAEAHAAPPKKHEGGVRGGNNAATGNYGDLYRFVLTGEWRRHAVDGVEQPETAYRAAARIVYSQGEGYATQDRTNDQEYTIFHPDPNHHRPGSKVGEQVYAYLHQGRFELINFDTDAFVRAKELFPVVVFERYVKEPDPDWEPGEGKTESDRPSIDVKQTWLVCPGGKGETTHTKVVHAFHVEQRRWSTSAFGELPISMSNFGGCMVPITRIVENEDGDDVAVTQQVLACGSGDTSETIKNIMQFYEFATGSWYMGEHGVNFAGCPLFPYGDKALVPGGRGAYYVSPPGLKASGQIGGEQLYQHMITPLWEIDPASASVDTRIPRRYAVCGATPHTESPTANREKKFLKSNFGGVSCEGRYGLLFLAFGGIEQGSSFPKAVVSYADGGLVDTEHFTERYEYLKTFPDSPVALGECSVVHTPQLGDKTRLISCPAILCLGGRHKTEEGMELHETIHWLDVETETWETKWLPSLPTKRYNAAATAIRWTDYDPEDEKKENPLPTIKVFFIGGRGVKRVGFDEDDNPVYEDKEHLLASMDVLDLRTMRWETGWPDMNNEIEDVSATV